MDNFDIKRFLTTGYTLPGIVVVLLAYLLSENNKLRNSLIIGLAHMSMHEIINMKNKEEK